MPSTKVLIHHSRKQKQDSPQIPTQPRPTTTTKKAPATAPSTQSNTVEFHIYQPPASLRGWADSHDLEAPLRYLGLLDVARHQLPTGVPRLRLVSQLITSYDPKRRCGYVYGSRVNVDRKSFLSAVCLHPTAERRDLPPNVPWSQVTRAAEQFINMCLQVQWRDMSPAVSAAMREVKAGSAHKVDWGKLMWDLVEDEILELPKRNDKISYFGVYLQRLIWAQQPGAFELYEKLEAVMDSVDKMQAYLDTCGEKRDKMAIRFGMKPMEAQSSQLGVMLNGDVGVGKNDSERLSSPPNDGKMHTDEHIDHTESQQRFQQGNQQKQAQNINNCGVPTGSAIAIANSSYDIADIEWEIKNATSKELGEAETFVRVVKLLQEKLSPETIMHMFE